MASHENGRQESPYGYDSFSGNGKKQPTETHFLWWCAGAWQRLLKDCPSEHTKYAGLGGIILATFVLAALSAGYAMYSVFSEGAWAICFALLWGLIIFNFDRFMVSTMRKYGISRRRQLWIASPRIALALLIGVTIARPLELKIFEKEIDVQVAENRHKKILLNDSLLQAEDRNALSSAQQERERLMARKIGLEDTLRSLQGAYTKEADGTGGSQRRGIAGLTRLKQDAYLSALQQFSPELQRLQGQIGYQDSILRETYAGREGKRRDYESRVAADVGFLEKNKALSDLSERESSVFWTNLLISLLIILLETGPILSKLIMNTGPYDVALAREELQQMATSDNAMRKDQELLLEKNSDITRRKKEMTKELMDKLSALQKKNVGEELDRWEAGKDPVTPRKPLGEIARIIKERYDYREEDVL